MRKSYYLLSIFILWGCAGKQYVPVDLIQQATPDKYSDANGVILFDSISVKVDSIGGAVYSYHKAIKILSTYGKKKFGEQEFSYVQKFMSLDIEFARIITSEGKVITIPKSDMKDIPFVPMDFEGSSGKMFLPDVRLVKVIFPQVDIGATIEYKLKLTIKKPFMANRFTDMVAFEGDEPIISQVYRIEFPTALKLNHLIKNGSLDFSESSTDNLTTYTWVAKDVAKILAEPLMPDLSEAATTLIISNIPIWDEISKWYYGLSVPAFTANDAIKAKVKEITDTLTTQDAKIRALFNFVSTEVRYLRTEAVSKDKGFEPALSTLTFERKWGVCRDKAALLVAMLKEIGVQSYIVLINVSRRTPKEVPTWAFEHAIVAIPKDNKYYYLDPTMEYTTDYLPIVEQNREVLLCTSCRRRFKFCAL